MIRRVFVDSDVILDLLLKRQPFYPSAVRFFELVQDGTFVGHISPLICSNLFYILRKALTPEEARAALAKLRVLLRVLTVDEKTVDLALASSFKDFEDALQYYTAVTFGLDAVITRNKRDYTTSEIPVFTPEECVAALDARGPEERSG